MFGMFCFFFSSWTWDNITRQCNRQQSDHNFNQMRLYLFLNTNSGDLLLRSENHFSSCPSWGSSFKSCSMKLVCPALLEAVPECLCSYFLDLFFFFFFFRSRSAKVMVCQTPKRKRKKKKLMCDSYRKPRIHLGRKMRGPCAETTPSYSFPQVE